MVQASFPVATGVGEGDTDTRPQQPNRKSADGSGAACPGEMEIFAGPWTPDHAIARRAWRRGSLSAASRAYSQI